MFSFNAAKDYAKRTAAAARQTLADAHASMQDTDDGDGERKAGGGESPKPSPALLRVPAVAKMRNSYEAQIAELKQELALSRASSSGYQDDLVAEDAPDALNKKGKRVEALGLLRRMAAIDPANITSRIKVANLLREEGLESEAVAEFDYAIVNDEIEGCANAVLEIIEAERAGDTRVVRERFGREATLARWRAAASS